MPTYHVPEKAFNLLSAQIDDLGSVLEALRVGGAGAAWTPVLDVAASPDTSTRSSPRRILLRLSSLDVDALLEYDDALVELGTDCVVVQVPALPETISLAVVGRLLSVLVDIEGMAELSIPIVATGEVAGWVRIEARGAVPFVSLQVRDAG